MPTKVFLRETCRLCGGREHDLALRLVPTPIGDHFVPKERLGEPQESFPLDLYQCRGCANVQLLKTIDPEVVYGEYLYTSSSSLGLPEHFRRYADSVMNRAVQPKGALVVEIGSNEGAMLRPFRERGMRVLGIDPARAIAQKATETGIETLPEFFTEALASRIAAKHGKAGIVIANNVFANIDDLADMAKGVRALLSDDGIFVFETSYLLDVVEKNLIDTIFHEHLCYFAVKPLEAYFKRFGMQLIDVERVPTKGGSIRGTVQLAGGKRPVSPSVAAQKELEARAELDRLDAYKALGARLEAVKGDLQKLLRELKAKGKVIASYGAAVGLTTMIYHFELGGLVSFMVDDYPAKQNTYSPGHHIPVHAPDAIYERKPDYILILAWRYADNIINKHRTYLDRGGHFVIPLPTLRVV